MRQNWVTVNEFIDEYKLSRSLAYRYVLIDDFPSMRVGKNAWRVDLNRTQIWLSKQFNQDRRIEEVE
jgi:hypothetical protein